MASVGTPTQITASVTGGVPGGYQMRATQVGADGTETRVLDWADMTANADSASALLSWNPTSSDTTLRIEVRDATHLRHPVTVALAGSPQPDPTPQVGSWSHNGSCWSYRYADGTVERSSTLTIDAQGIPIRREWVREDRVGARRGLVVLPLLDGCSAERMADAGHGYVLSGSHNRCDGHRLDPDRVDLVPVLRQWQVDSLGSDA